MRFIRINPYSASGGMPHRPRATLYMEPVGLLLDRQSNARAGAFRKR